MGATYDFSFWTKAYSTNFGNKLSYSIGDSGVFSVGTTTDWLNTVGTFAATSTTSTIAIFFETNSGTGTWNIDDVYVDTSVVPVPATAWLFGSGLLGLIGVDRRKKT